MLKYKKISKIGQGSHGTVYKCEVMGDGAKSPKKYVALKKMKITFEMSSQGLSSQIIRELMYMQELKHPNILKLIEVDAHSKGISLVFDFIPTNLEKIIHTKNIKLTDANVKTFLRMLLEGIRHCHKNWILHRDIKPSNCLVTEKGVLKIADFGLAKSFGHPDFPLSPEACTLWYRAPELLFGAKHYGEAMDMWSVGCIFGEMLLRKVIFPGNRTEISQLSTIFAILGSPGKENWDSAKLLPSYFEFEKNEPVDLKSLFPLVSEEALDLFSKICLLDPKKRLTASEALKHRYFSSPPREKKMDMLFVEE